MAPGSAAAASSKDGACAHAREGAEPVRILAGSGSARGGERGAWGKRGAGHTERSRGMEPGPRVGEPRGREPRRRSGFYWVGEEAERRAQPWGKKRGVCGGHWPFLLARVMQGCWKWIFWSTRKLSKAEFMGETNDSAAGRSVSIVRVCVCDSFGLSGYLIFLIQASLAYSCPSVLIVFHGPFSMKWRSCEKRRTYAFQNNNC